MEDIAGMWEFGDNVSIMFDLDGMYAFQELYEENGEYWANIAIGKYEINNDVISFSSPVSERFFHFRPVQEPALSLTLCSP